MSESQCVEVFIDEISKDKFLELEKEWKYDIAYLHKNGIQNVTILVGKAFQHIQDVEPFLRNFENQNHQKQKYFHMDMKSLTLEEFELKKIDKNYENAKIEKEVIEFEHVFSESGTSDSSEDESYFHRQEFKKDIEEIAKKYNSLMQTKSNQNNDDLICSSEYLYMIWKKEMFHLNLNQLMKMAWNHFSK